MRILVAFVAILAGIGCSSRQFTVDPSEVRNYNSSDWIIKSEPRVQVPGKPSP